MDLSNNNVIHIKGKETEYLQFKKLLEYSDKVSHAYVVGLNNSFRTSKGDNNLISLEELNKTIKSYNNICNELGVEYSNIIKPVQRHTKNVEIIEENENNNMPDFSSYENTDGLITNKKDIVLSTTNADCILMMFYDPIKNVIANIHSGWRGTLQRISVNTVEKMKKEFGCDAENIICCICPSIRKCHFEVDKDVYELFYEEFKDLEHIDEIIEKKEKKWHIDTVLINKILLKDQGLKEDNIVDSNICSVCNKSIIHSYRSEGKNFGLLTAIISLK